MLVILSCGYSFIFISAFNTSNNDLAQVQKFIKYLVLSSKTFTTTCKWSPLFQLPTTFLYLLRPSPFTANRTHNGFFLQELFFSRTSFYLTASLLLQKTSLQTQRLKTFIPIDLRVGWHMANQAALGWKQ